MKKFLLLVIIFLFCLSVFGCTMPQRQYVELNASKDNFKEYVVQVEQILEEKGYKPIKKEIDDVKMTLSIKIDEEFSIELRLYHSGTPTSLGLENFVMEYNHNLYKSTTEFDTELFVDLVNAISGREITKTYCDTFLEAAEKKYSAAKYGYSGENGPTIYKIDMLNFWEDWIISYQCYALDSEILEFSGLTEASVVHK